MGFQEKIVFAGLEFTGIVSREKLVSDLEALILTTWPSSGGHPRRGSADIETPVMGQVSVRAVGDRWWLKHTGRPIKPTHYEGRVNGACLWSAGRASLSTCCLACTGHGTGNFSIFFQLGSEMSLCQRTKNCPGGKRAGVGEVTEDPHTHQILAPACVRGGQARGATSLETVLIRHKHPNI